MTQDSYDNQVDGDKLPEPDMGDKQMAPIEFLDEDDYEEQVECAQILLKFKRAIITEPIPNLCKPAQPEEPKPSTSSSSVSPTNEGDTASGESRIQSTGANGRNKRKYKNSRKGNRVAPKDYTEVQIGPNRTIVFKHVLDSIKWTKNKGYRAATRKLLRSQFSREILASHSLSGKPSPAFLRRPIKAKLNPKIIEDIISYVPIRIAAEFNNQNRKCDISSLKIRTSITSACADEHKMLRKREKRMKQALSCLESNNANVSNGTPDSPDLPGSPDGSDTSNESMMETDSD